MTRFESALALALILGPTLVFSFCPPAIAVNWEPSGSADIDAWYARARKNEGGSCCGTADAYWGQMTAVEDRGVWVLIDDDRPIAGRLPRDKQEFFVPNEMLDRKHQGNPTGHLVLFVRASDSEPLCLFPEAGI